MSIPTELNTDQLKKEFEKYDQNKDGVLDAHEIKIIIDDMHAKSNQYYSECQSKQRESRRMSILPKISLPSNIQNLTNNLLKSPKKENVRNSTSSNRRKSNSSVSPRLSSKVSPRGSCCDTEVTDSGRSSYNYSQSTDNKNISPTIDEINQTFFKDKSLLSPYHTSNSTSRNPSPRLPHKSTSSNNSSTCQDEIIVNHELSLEPDSYPDSVCHLGDTVYNPHEDRDEADLMTRRRNTRIFNRSDSICNQLSLNDNQYLCSSPNSNITSVYTHPSAKNTRSSSISTSNHINHTSSQIHNTNNNNSNTNCNTSNYNTKSNNSHTFTPTSTNTQTTNSEPVSEGLNFDEFLSIVKIVQERDIELKQRFDFFDKNGDGKITKKELKKGLMKLNEKSDSKTLKLMMTSADLNGDGLIDFEEFKNIILIGEKNKCVE